MNKSLLTNSIALILTVAGLILPCSCEILFKVGVFAFSGGVTNWLAIHMLFEKVPFLYGSGIIQNRFKEFKSGIKNLIITQFFTAERIEIFLKENKGSDSLKDKINFNKVFVDLTDAIEASQLGSMLAMVGGKEALEPLREPIIGKLKETLDSIQNDMANKDSFAKDLAQKVESVVDERLEELSAKEVKEIIQTMIREHLGWLVVWGGVFGGLIGFLVSMING